jgi:uncharacterized membrane protein YuzA (DUF378 family)
MNAVAYVLVIIGALNWGLVGVANMDLVAYLPMVVAKIVYILVGLSAIWLLIAKAKGKKPAAPEAPSAPSMDQQM